MNKKRNTIITIIIIIIIFLIGITYFALNYSKDNSSLTVLEKKWITDNINNIIDVDVYNNIPVFGYNGKGMIFDFLDYITKEEGINFNKISYYVGTNNTNTDISFQVIKNNEKLKNKDILLYEDTYAIYKEETSDSINLTEKLNLGYLKEDENILKNYFEEPQTISQYQTTEELLTALKNKEIDGIILPINKSMDTILKNKLNLVYHLSDIKLNYILRIGNKTVYTILKKSYLEYLKNQYQEDYSKNYLEMYFDSTNTKDISRKNYNAKTYKYGYVTNMPYENDVNGEFVGTISNYLEEFSKVTNTDIEIKHYENIDELKSALISKEIDFALGNFDYHTINLEKYETGQILSTEYVILSKQNYVMNSIKGISNKKISVVSGSKLYYLCKENNISVSSYEDTDELLRNIDDNSIILLDKQAYLYYKNTKLKDYKINFESSLENGYHFIMNNSNQTFNELFNYYALNMNYDQVKYLYRTSITIDKDYTTIKIFVFIIALIIFLTGLVLFISRKNITSHPISKEEILKYVDPMTSLKNRNYLNANIYKWDDNVIFPQGVIVLDLNQLKEVNDKLGREAGDEIIKKVAGILINTQLENTDIIRSGGDEFIIYTVGYEEKELVEYTRKISRMMKNIPNSLGIEVGYSMILDEVKTVDDAINEAILMMTKNKEKRK